MENEIKGAQIYLSSLTIVEMKASLIRLIRGGSNLIKPIEEILQKFDEEKRVDVLLSIVLGYLKSRFNIHIADDEFLNSLYNLINLSVLPSAKNKVIRSFARALELSRILTLRTLDLLHLIYAEALKRRGFVSVFVTFDKDFIKNAEVIKRNLGIDVIPKVNF